MRFIATLPPGTPAQETLAQVESVESAVAPYSDIYAATIGGAGVGVGEGPTGFNQSTIFASLREGAPEGLTAALREELGGVEGRRVAVNEVSDGPPAAGVGARITGSDYADISDAATRLTRELQTLESVANVVSDVSEARDEIVVDVDPSRAAALGLDARQVRPAGQPVHGGAARGGRRSGRRDGRRDNRRARRRHRQRGEGARADGLRPARLRRGSATRRPSAFSRGL